MPIMIGKAFLILGAVTLAQARAPKSGTVDPICNTQQFAEQLLPHEDCNKFYQCSNGAAIVQKCAADLHFNFQKQVCDHPETANCGTLQASEPSPDDPHNAVDSAYEQDATAKCRADDSDGVLLPHENCNQFYKCSQGAPVAQDCPAGLNYDPSKQICEWAYLVVCDDRKTGAVKAASLYASKEAAETLLSRNILKHRQLNDLHIAY